MYKYLANPRKHKKTINHREDKLYISIKEEYGLINYKEYLNIKKKLDDYVNEEICKSLLNDIIEKVVN